MTKKKPIMKGNGVVEKYLFEVLKKRFKRMFGNKQKINVGGNLIYDLFSPNLSKLPTRAQEVFDKYKNDVITKMSIRRQPLQSILQKTIKSLVNIPYDDMYHLALIVECGGKSIIIEKLHIVNINDRFSTDAGCEYFDVKIDKQITLGTLINNTIKKIGDYEFYDYHIINRNCQIFVKELLVSNGLLTDTGLKFLYQDFTQQAKENPIKIGVAHAITRVANIANKFLGIGDNTVVNIAVSGIDRDGKKVALHKKKKITQKMALEFSSVKKKKIDLMKQKYSKQKRIELFKLFGFPKMKEFQSISSWIISV